MKPIDPKTWALPGAVLLKDIEFMQGLYQSIRTQKHDKQRKTK
jgi:hypothetical protein